MEQRAERPATLTRIAEEAGVSLPTVSKVLNGRADVAPATRARVQELLDRYDYQPVRRRRGRERLVVDLVFAHLDSPWAIEIIRGVVESGLEVVIDSMDLEPHWAKRVADSGRAGAIVVTSDLGDAERTVLTRAGVAVAVIDPVDMPDPDLPSVGTTNWAGGLAATRHLVDLGHERIAAISGPRDYLCSRARLDGYRAAMERADLSDLQLVRHATLAHEGGYREALAMLAMPERPTAIFAGSDEQALGVVEAARSLGIAVPGDLSVVGFDDLPFARLVSPPLTTVRQPLAEMGRAAGQMLAVLMAGKALDSPRVELATRLVVRSSTAPPPWSAVRSRP